MLFGPTAFRRKTCWRTQMLPVSSDNSREFLKLKKKSLLQSFSDGEQTVRERSDIDLLRLRVMFKSIRLQGVDWSGFIKCKHFQERHSLKWEKSRELGMRKRQKANEKRKREQFLCFKKKRRKFLEPSLLLCSQLRIDERVCWMMELFSLSGGCSPCVWLWHETMGSSPRPTLPEHCVDKDVAPTTAVALVPATTPT